MDFRIIKAFIRHNLRFFILLVLCSAICFSVFVTFRSVQASVDTGMNGYLDDYRYYDGLIQPYFGSFFSGDAEKVRAIGGIADVSEVYTIDSVLSGGDNTRYVRLIGVDLAEQHFYFLDEKDSGDIYLSAEFADRAGLAAGDEIRVSFSGREVPLVIRAVVNDPKLMGATRSIGPSMELSSLGYAYLSLDQLGEYADVSLPNTLVYYLKDDADPVAVRDEVNAVFAGRQFYYEENDSRHAIGSIRSDLDVLKPVATVLPLVMYLVGLVVSVLFLRQFMEIKVRDIGNLRANGVSRGGVVRIFVGYALTVAVSGSVLGTLLSVIQSRIYTDFYTDAVYVPRFEVRMDFGDIILASLITALITVAAVFINVRQITGVDIVEIMNGSAEIEKGSSSKLCGENAVVLKPFVAPVFKKPAMFLFSLINMILVCIIVTASLGVRDAKDNSIAFLYEKEVGYDYALHYYSYAALANNGDNAYKETYADVGGEYSRLYVMNNTDYVHIYDVEEHLLSLGGGIILYDKLAEKLGVAAGDTVSVNGREVTVDALCKAVSDYKCYMSFAAYENLFGAVSCNAYFIKGDLPAFDDSPESGFFYVSSTRSLEGDLADKFSYISNYILIIIGISCFICVIVIYNLSLIFFRSRSREHTILRTLGCSRGSILAGSLIEILLQSVLTLLVGIPLGYELAAYTVHAIANDSITMYISFSDIPVVTVAVFILVTAVLGRMAASRGRIRLLPEET